MTARSLIRWLPKSLKKPAEAIEMLWNVGALAQPLEALRHLRHRAQFERLQKSLFYHRYASAILLAHELGLFERIAAGRAPTDGRLNANGIDALTRVLESEGLLRRAGDRFALTPFAERYLARSSPHAIAGMLDLMSAQAAAFGEVPARLADGHAPAALDIFADGSRYRAFLGAVNEYLDAAGRDLLARIADERVPAALDILSDGSRYRAFLGAVNEYLDAAGRDLLARIELGRVERFIVGSMGVSFSARVLERHPEARVTYGCLEHLVREIPRLRERFRVPPERVDGMHAHGGDPEADRWGDERFDLVFLTKKMILQPSERLGEKFARKAFHVLSPGGTAIFWETVHTDDGATPIARAMEAVLDLFTSPGGRVNTERGLRALLGEIGFTSIEIVPCLGGQTTFVVARKPR